MTKTKHRYSSVKDSIDSDRNSGFKNTAYAVAELIDNSIQAGFRAKQKICSVDLIVVTEKTSINGKNIDRISSIIVSDNAEGMDEDTLGIALSKGKSINKSEKGYGKMGRYGFGLYMSSISQCRRTDIFTWQKDMMLKSWLDIDEIIDSEDDTAEYVPVEKINNLPDDLKDIIDYKNHNYGTIVKWSKLDKSNWKTAEGLFRNLENEIGRMYRYFINDGKVKISYKHFKKIGNKFKLEQESAVRANDPLYLMKNTTCPAPWDKKPGFTEAEPEIIKLNINGEQKEIKIKFAISKEEMRGIEESGGAKPHGKHAAKNVGVSIIRSGRELELNSSWDNPSDPRERWVGAEIHFEGEKEIDNLLRVTNNKQYARALKYVDVKKEAEELDMNIPAYLNYLQDTDFEKYLVTDISQKIKKRLSTLLSSIREWRKGTGPKKPITGSAEDITSKARAARTKKTDADKKNETLDKKKKLEIMIERLTAGGMDQETAVSFAKMNIERNISTIITSEPISSSPVFFDIRIVEGQYQIIINKEHPAYLDFFNIVEKESDNKSVDEPSSDRAIKLMLSSWASLEDEAASNQDEYASHLKDIRLRWGQIFRDLLIKKN